ncbi:restriction endonuclease subunit S [Acinetobacter pittii]|uniref:restriction endonuclease subunit S n=1 Tax=Acinetobacter pittii TaxID=48296 RepID=UPI00192B6F26|nr:restriction endonuclease subunit S [Acinetobacter pittii]
MAKYQKYAKYQDSGVEWLGEIPSHWDSKPLKYLCTYNDEVLLETTFKEAEIQYIDIGSVSAVGGISHIEMMIFKDAPSRARRIVKDGDVIISTVRTYLEAIAPIDNPPENLIVSTGFAVIRPNQYLYKGFAAYCLRAKGFIKEVVARSVGVSYPAINSSELVNITIPSVEYSEQVKIANFLDHETAKIDTLIAKQEKLIALLKEKRQAVISHAVTKGLNPNVPVKDSGVEWLGVVPEHWEVCKIQYYAKIESGHTPSKTNEKYWENCTIPWVSLNDSKQLRAVDYISDTKYKISELGLANSSARILPKDTVVFTRDASIGLSAITTKEMAVSQHLIAWLPKKEKLSPEFLLLIFYAMEKEFNRYTFGSTIKTIGMDDVSSLIAAFPSLAEQLDIVERCFNQFVIIDKSIEKSLALLEILKEKRIALISAAVTGKIDVRHWQNPHNNNNQDNMELSA